MVQLQYLTASRTQNYVPTALTLSLPRAMLYYAVALASSQALVWVEGQTNIYVIGGIMLVFFLASLPWKKWFGLVVECLPKCSGRRSDAEEVDAVDIV